MRNIFAGADRREADIASREELECVISPSQESLLSNGNAPLHELSQTGPCLRGGVSNINYISHVCVRALGGYGRGWHHLHCVESSYVKQAPAPIRKHHRKAENNLPLEINEERRTLAQAINNGIGLRIKVQLQV